MPVFVMDIFYVSGFYCSTVPFYSSMHSRVIISVWLQHRHCQCTRKGRQQMILKPNKIKLNRKLKLSGEQELEKCFMFLFNT